MITSLQFSIHNFQFSMNDQFSIYNVATARQMLNVKLLSTVNCKLLTASGGSLA